MAINPAIKTLFVLMLENRSYDNLLGWTDLRGWQPDGKPTEADGLIGKSPFTNQDRAGTVHVIGQGAPFRLTFDPGHEFSDVLLQGCGPDAQGVTGPYQNDGTLLTNGVYPPLSMSANQTGFACSLEQYNYDISSGLRCYSPDQLPVINFLAHQYAVCDRWFSSLPGPTWPNRFFALAGTSWGLDFSPSDFRMAESDFFDSEKFGTGSDSLLTRLQPNEWLVAHGDIPQSKSIKGTDQNGRSERFIEMDELFSRLASSTMEDSVKFVFIEPTYDPIGGFKGGDSMHPTGDVRKGEALIKSVYEAIKDSAYWNQSVLLITFDEHGGFFDHVLPTEANVTGPFPASSSPTSLTKHGFRFDQFGLRVPSIIISPYVRQATVDHTFYDHLSIAKTLAEIARPTGYSQNSLLTVNRFTTANSFSGVFSLSQPRAATDIPACPSPLPLTLSTPKSGRGPSAQALLNMAR